MVGWGFLFPGQGAQYVGMGEDFYREFEAARRVYDAADQSLRYSLSQLCFKGPEEELTRTVHSQPAIFVTSLAILEVLKAQFPQIEPAVCCGLSLGEYTALVAASSIRFEDALQLVRKRGELMEEAARNQPGTMASLMGLDVTTCERLCKESGVELANLNAPDQTVISGPRPAVEKAMELARKAGAKRAIELNVGGAFHSSLMLSASRELTDALRQVMIQRPRVRFVANVTAQFSEDPKEIRHNLAKQVTAPVRWVQTMELLHREGIVKFLEIGPGKVLKGLAKRIHADFSIRPIGTIGELSELGLLKTV